MGTSADGATWLPLSLDEMRDDDLACYVDRCNVSSRKRRLLVIRRGKYLGNYELTKLHSVDVALPCCFL